MKESMRKGKRKVVQKYDKFRLKIRGSLHAYFRAKFAPDLSIFLVCFSFL